MVQQAALAPPLAATVALHLLQHKIRYSRVNDLPVLIPRLRAEHYIAPDVLEVMDCKTARDVAWVNHFKLEKMAAEMKSVARRSPKSQLFSLDQHTAVVLAAAAEHIIWAWHRRRLSERYDLISPEIPDSSAALPEVTHADAG